MGLSTLSRFEEMREGAKFHGAQPFASDLISPQAAGFMSRVVRFEAGRAALGRRAAKGEGLAVDDGAD